MSFDVRTGAVLVLAISFLIGSAFGNIAKQRSLTLWKSVCLSPVLTTLCIFIIWILWLTVYMFQGVNWHARVVPALVAVLPYSGMVFAAAIVPSAIGCLVGYVFFSHQDGPDTGQQ